MKFLILYLSENLQVLVLICENYLYLLLKLHL